MHMPLVVAVQLTLVYGFQGELSLQLSTPKSLLGHLRSAEKNSTSSVGVCVWVGGCVRGWVDV